MFFKFTGNPAGVRRVLLAFVLLLLIGALGWCGESKAGEGAGLSVGLGRAAVGGELCLDSLLITQELGGARWLAALATHGEGICRSSDTRANMGAAALRVTHIRGWAFGVGAGLWEHGDRAVGPEDSPDRPQLCAQLLVRRYVLRGRAVVDLLHCSTGGSTHYNPGLNLLTFGVRVP